MSELLSKINGSSIKKAPVFYKGWFGRLHEVEIVVKEKYRKTNVLGCPYTFYKYVIKFKNGRTKYVKEEQLIMEGDD